MGIPPVRTIQITHRPKEDFKVGQDETREPKPRLKVRIDNWQNPKWMEGDKPYWQSLKVGKRLHQFVFLISAQGYLSSFHFNIFTVELFNFFQIHDIGFVYP